MARRKEIFMILGLEIICLTIATADQFGDPKVILKCGHLSAQGDQYNFFKGTYGQQCCMCWKGTFVAKECSGNNPNSTRCHPCEYDLNKQTFVDFEPHMERECKLDIISCRSDMEYVPGSRFLRASCVCPLGTIEVVEHIQICHPVLNISLKVRTTKNVSTTTSAGTLTNVMKLSTTPHIAAIIILVACVITLLGCIIGERCGLFGGLPCTRIYGKQVRDEEVGLYFPRIPGESDPSGSCDRVFEPCVSVEMEPRRGNVQSDETCKTDNQEIPRGI